jgi:hypothetical protein
VREGSSDCSLTEVKMNKRMVEVIILFFLDCCNDFSMLFVFYFM